MPVQIILVNHVTNRKGHTGLTEPALTSNRHGTVCLSVLHIMQTCCSRISLCDNVNLNSYAKLPLSELLTTVQQRL